MQKNKAFFYSTVFIIFLQVCSFRNSYAMTPEETIQLGTEVTGSIIAESIQAIIGAGSCIGAMVNVYEVGKDVKSYLCPSMEEQVRDLEIQKQLELIELRRNLRTCLIENRKSTEKGLLGLPSQCENVAFLLGIMGSPDEVEKKMTVFKAFNK